MNGPESRWSSLGSQARGMLHKQPGSPTKDAKPSRWQRSLRNQTIRLLGPSSGSQRLVHKASKLRLPRSLTSSRSASQSSASTSGSESLSIPKVPRVEVTAEASPPMTPLLLPHQPSLSSTPSPSPQLHLPVSPSLTSPSLASRSSPSCSSLSSPLLRAPLSPVTEPARLSRTSAPTSPASPAKRASSPASPSRLPKARRVIQKRASEYSMPRRKPKTLRPYKSKLDLLDQHLTSFDLEPPDTNSIYIVEDYLDSSRCMAPSLVPGPAAATTALSTAVGSAGTGPLKSEFPSQMCMKCHKSIDLECFLEIKKFRVVCNHCMDFIDPPSGSRIIKIEPQHGLAEPYYVVESFPEWMERIQKHLRWRWRLGGLF